MITLQAGKTLSRDDKGYTHALLTINESTREITIKNDKDSDGSLIIDEGRKEIKPVIELSFLCETTSKEKLIMDIALFGTKVNFEPVKSVRKGKKMINLYNKLTCVIIQLGLVTKDEIIKGSKDMSIIDLDVLLAELLAVKELPVKFIPVKNKNGFWEPDWLTLEVTGDMPIEENN